MSHRPRNLLTLGALLAALAANPAPTAVNTEVERLGNEMRSLLASYRWQTATWGVHVVSLDRGDTLFSSGADTPMAPASNVKLLTSAAALALLGPDFRYRTWLVTDGTVEDGVLHGDLSLYGTGDPGMSDRMFPRRTTAFEGLVQQLQALGIHTVRGDLVGDASFLSGPLRPDAWDPADLNDHFAPGVSALSFNENVVSLRVEPGPAAGTRPVVHTLPDHAGLDVENTAVTVEGTPRPRLAILRDDPALPIRVEGGIQRGGRDVWRQFTVSDPARFALSVFRSVLVDGGITVSGSDRVVTSPLASMVGGARLTVPVRGNRPRTRVLAHHLSPPLRDYLAVVNKRSNNLYAELTFRTLGRVQEGDGSPESAARAVSVVLSDLGVDLGGTIQVDGSGLAAANRVAPVTLVELLRTLDGSPLWADFWDTLPEAGIRRELSRMYRSPAAGNLRGKTGTIEAVSALSGVVRTAEGERLAFSIIVNGTPSTSGAKRIENAIGVRLASFRRADGTSLAAGTAAGAVSGPARP